MVEFVTLVALMGVVVGIVDVDVVVGVVVHLMCAMCAVGTQDVYC